VTEPTRDKKNPALVGLVVVLFLLVAGALLVLRTEGAPRERPTAVEALEPSPPPRPVPSLTPVLDYAADGVPFKPHDPSRTPDPEGPMHPHPHTPEHERIFRENNLVGALGGAMDQRDTAGMRQLLAEYRRDYPEDSHLLQQGFAVIADCIDHPGEASTAAARAYYDANKASNIRRYVRRHCFEQGR
jgi:hypothetical protein